MKTHTPLTCPPKTGPCVVLGFGPKTFGCLGGDYGEETVSSGADHLQVEGG